ncbi:hypothetical protein [Sulfuritalea hydrogenivorans]|jgi:hypothetical protein|uniref:hypothetical protein n=1 Tax=Sulfuritalea hydrogenivorans TaxID=748811 RepID=UPI0005971F10|nr:hypothetical protein [Sulfuritalea hydrogenivorans]MDK9714836.1 hypothetical protein [Sulfuritalea sp.]
MPNTRIDLKPRRFKVLRKPLKVFHTSVRLKRQEVLENQPISPATQPVADVLASPLKETA